jgi:hypothetical protein
MKMANARAGAWTIAVAMLGVVLVIGIGPAFAQSPAKPADPHHPVATTPAPSAGAMGEPRDRMMPMMDMCRQMMGGTMMGGPMMGMGADGKIDPKMMAHMLEMRGEMMKAMGEVMMKHGAMMRGGATN